MNKLNWLKCELHNHFENRNSKIFGMFMKYYETFSEKEVRLVTIISNFSGTRKTENLVCSYEN